MEIQESVVEINKIKVNKIFSKTKNRDQTKNIIILLIKKTITRIKMIMIVLKKNNKGITKA